MIHIGSFNAQDYRLDDQHFFSQKINQIAHTDINIRGSFCYFRFYQDWIVFKFMISDDLTKFLIKYKKITLILIEFDRSLYDVDQKSFDHEISKS